jgi:hypothetical protein
MADLEIRKYVTGEGVTPEEYKGGSSGWLLRDGDKDNTVDFRKIKIVHDDSGWFRRARRLFRRGSARVLTADGRELSKLRSGQSAIYWIDAPNQGENEYVEVFHGTRKIDRDLRRIMYVVGE